MCYVVREEQPLRRISARAMVIAAGAFLSILVLIGVVVVTVAGWDEVKKLDTTRLVAAIKNGGAKDSPPTSPDATLHPGATNPAVSQSNIGSTICKSGFTKSVRPTESYTANLKQQQMRDEGLPGNSQDYEEDHLISLELGGAPQDPKNLWPEPYENRGARLAAPGTGSESKDKVENETKGLVCSGKMSLSDAQNRIASDWHKLGVDEGVL